MNLMEKHILKEIKIFISLIKSTDEGALHTCSSCTTKGIEEKAENPEMVYHATRNANVCRLDQLQASCLVNLLNLRTVVGSGSSTGTGAGHATGHTTLSTASLLVKCGHNGVSNSLKLLLLRLVLLLGGGGVGVDPLNGLVDLGLELLLVIGRELLLNLGVGDGVLERVGVGLEAVLGADTGSLSLILLLVLLGLGEHALDLLLGETALVVGDDNLVGLAGTLLEGRDVHDTVGINVEGDLNLGNTTRGRRNTGKLELAEKVVVLGAGTLTLEDLDQDTRLVVGEGGEGLGLLGGDSGVALDESSHDTTSGLDTERQRCDVEKKDLVGGLGGSVTRENGGLDGSTVGNGFIGVDGLVGLLATEEVGDHLLDLGNTGGTTDKNDLVDGGLVDLSVTESALDGLHGATEEVLAELLESGTSEGGVEVDTLEERVDLERGLSRRRQGTLGTLASGSQTTESTGVGGKILLVLSLELVDEVVDEAVVKVLTTQVSVTGGRLNLEDTLLDGKERDIESTTTKIEDEDVALTLNLLVETVGNGSGGGLVDDTEDVEASDQTGILGSLALRVVEVGGDSDDSVVDGATKVRLGGLTHLGEDHGGDLLRGEGLLLTLELDLNNGLAGLLDDLEGEVLHIGLNLSIGELATNETLGVEDGVVRVHGDLVLGRITDQTLGVGEGNERGSGAVTLVVGDNLNAVITVDTRGTVSKSSLAYGLEQILTRHMSRWYPNQYR